MADIDFDQENTEASVPFELLPDGWYRVVLDKSDRKAINGGKGDRLACEFVVIEQGPYENRKLFEGLNLWFNDPAKDDVKNGETRAYAQRDYVALVHACGKIVAARSDELHNIPIMVKVKTRAASGNYEAQNIIKGYAVDGKGGPTPDVAKATSTTGKGPARAPWGQKK